MGNINRSIVLSFRDVLLWFTFFIVIGSECFQTQYKFPLLFALFNILSKVIFVTSLILHIIRCLRYKKQFFTKYDILLLLLFSWLVCSSILNGHSWIMQVPFVMKSLSIRYIFTLYTPNRKEKIITILSSVFTFIVYLNFFQLLFFSSIMGYVDGDKVYLISTNYNQFGAVFMPAIFLKIIESFQTGCKRSLILLFVVCVASVAIEGSATATISILLLLLTVVFVKKYFFLKVENISILVGIVLFFFTFVLPVLSIFNVPFVSSFVEGLGKDMTFSHRTSIWIYALFQISYSPLIGYGVCDKEWFQLLLSNAVNTHNIVLHVLIQGGVVGLILFAMFVYTGIKQVLSVENKYQRSLLIAVVIIFFLMSQFEVYINTFVYMFVFFMFISKDVLTCKFIEK